MCNLFTRYPKIVLLMSRASQHWHIQRCNVISECLDFVFVKDAHGIQFVFSFEKNTQQYTWTISMQINKSYNVVSNDLLMMFANCRERTRMKPERPCGVNSLKKNHAGNENEC